MPTEKRLKKYQVDEKTYTAMKKKGLVLNTYKSMSGQIEHNYVGQPKSPEPRILIVEKYRLSTYLGQYGAGRIVKTFSLLPGEKTSISVSTYKKTSTKATEASSILDSYTEETAKQFEESLSSEDSSTENSEKNFNYHAEAEVSASWGWGNAKVSGGVDGGTSSSREEFSKNVASSTSNNSASASSKRDVEINTSFESTSEKGTEKSITREISNINVGKTLNFTFRQMNQEFITLLHLVDVRVAFFNGFRGSKVSVPLSEMDDLLETFVVKSSRDDVRRAIIRELRSVKDYQGNTVSVIKKSDNGEYWHFTNDLRTTYTDENENEFLVPGVIVNANKNVMRTDGVIVESLLGQASALDNYSKGLQDEKVKSQELDNQLKELEVQLATQKLDILTRKDKAASEVYKNLYPVEEAEE